MSSLDYVPLRTARSTRLLKILPGPIDSPLAIELSEANLDDNPSYDAISYTWSDETSTVPISINERPHCIRKNLHNFLVRLREQSYCRYVWVDAISIRQDDTNEKGRQVAMIGDIFRGAKQVLVWVGEHADRS